MQDEFTLVRDPPPFSGMKGKTRSSASEQKHHHPQHHRKFERRLLKALLNGHSQVLLALNCFGKHSFMSWEVRS
jgi:hypothetical protein